MENLGRYQIIEQLGVGAMGAVHKAHDPRMGRDVAIKTILAQAIEGPQAAEFRERFFREAQAAGRLAHPGIVTVYDVSEYEGIPFLVMEYVAGRTLQSIFQGGERLDMDRVLDFGIQLAEALDYAHRNGVIHRDIKPANMLITLEGRVKIADFGVARLAESQVTSTGQLLVTPAVMAPEQFTGAKIDGRADLFAAGVVIYWMATGEKPFTGDSTLAVQYKVVNSDPVPPRKLNPAISSDFEAVIIKSIAKDPAQRYQSGEEFARDLRALRSGGQILGTAPTMIFDGDSPTVVTDSQIRQIPAFAEDPAAVRTRHGASGTIVLPAKERRFATRAVVATIVVVALGLAAVGIEKTTREEDAHLSKGDNGTARSTRLQFREQASVAGFGRARPSLLRNRILSPGRDSEGGHDHAGTHRSATDQSVFRTQGQPTQTLAMKPGDSVTLHGKKEATLTVSNAAALQAKLNGKILALGAVHGSGQFVITPKGLDESWGSPPAAGARSSTSPDTAPLHLTRDTASSRGNRGFIGSPARQKELAQSATSGRLVIKSPAVAEFLTVIVRVDNGFFFRRDATAAPPAGLENGRGRLQTGEIPTTPLAEERLLPPGAHTFQVSVLLGTTRVGQVQELTTQFDPGQRRTLLIQFQRDNQRGGLASAAPTVSTTATLE